MVCKEKLKELKMDVELTIDPTTIQVIRTEQNSVCLQLSAEDGSDISLYVDHRMLPTLKLVIKILEDNSSSTEEVK